MLWWIRLRCSRSKRLETLFQIDLSVAQAWRNIRIRQVADEDRGALGQRQDGVGLYLRVGREYPLCQAGDDGFGQRQVLEPCLVSALFRAVDGLAQRHAHLDGQRIPLFLFLLVLILVLLSLFLVGS